ncbi:uncharacterized protein KQ657_003923 [Scheffersomyces spartinae]|uniref:Uncharacterized protein n=1 Tax=Scheffersomyces spartinae TaxID=45513 RepID=A0A9P7V5C5_9ASCO|nr:uncharacterized protein KQ657_003923 [Scheffersomyces spartinae]KAG7191266.1 hypothetical protein KQ657_003923 [Scheffersomyces spartinae]
MYTIVPGTSVVVTSTEPLVETSVTTYEVTTEVEQPPSTSQPTPEINNTIPTEGAPDYTPSSVLTVMISTTGPKGSGSTTTSGQMVPVSSQTSVPSDAIVTTYEGKASQQHIMGLSAILVILPLLLV